ncbi:MAG TPA: AAA family ATPase [Thermoanaerobaculia bacterium]|nr:AAA family ATPase [Thermoanaerobaculia bacterium]
MPVPLRPAAIAAALEQRVVGQRAAVREMAVALAKRLADVGPSNILLIGSSGSGKTTLLLAVEEYLASHPELRLPVARIHANVLGEEAERGRPGESVLVRLLQRARELLGEDADTEAVLGAAEHGVVFVDEIDKIRSRVGGEPHLRGIRAQEALLTLMEGETIEMELPASLGGGSAAFDSAQLWFVGAGAFEGLYEAVYDRITVGTDRGSLLPVTVVEAGGVRQETPFLLRNWLRLEDLFEYGMGPQFLSRFASTVLLDELGEGELLRILLERPEAGYQEARRFFAAFGVELALSPAAAQRIAAAAKLRRRIGARALREIFHRIVREQEFDPAGIAGGVLSIDVSEVEAALGGDDRRR